MRNLRYPAIVIGLTALFLLPVNSGVMASEDPLSNTRTFSLEEAVEFALTHNTAIQKAREYRNWGESRYVEERSAAFPQLSINLSSIRQNDTLQSKLTGSPEDTTIYGSSITLSQPLFTWGQVGAGIRAARYGIQMADSQIKQNEQDVTTAVIKAFNDILLARELLLLSEENLSQKERHLDEAIRKQSLGTATDFDVLAARVTRDNVHPMVIESKNTVRIATDRLRYIMGCEDRDIEIRGEIYLPGVQIPAYDNALELALRQRPELEAMKNQTEIAEEIVRIYKAGNKPRLDMQGAYSWSSLKTDAYDESGDSWSIGLYFSFPFFDGLRTSGKVRGAQSDLNSIKLEMANLIQAISLELHDALNRLKEADEIAKASSGNIEQATRLLELSEKGFRLGVMTRLDVEDAELNLLTAKSNFAKAKHDFLNAIVQFRRSIGIKPLPIEIPRIQQQ